MENAKRDQNFVPTLLGVSNVDGATPVPIYADPVTHRLLVDLPSGTGTVTSVSVVSANGFAGTVATATSTPAITLSTTITGILKGNGTSISAVTIGSGLSFDGTTLSAPGGAGTVTSVDMTVPTGLVVTGNPITTTGTLAVALDTGYVIPLSSTLATYVVGPASAIDNALARYDSTTGKLIQDGTLSASDVAVGAVTLATIGNNDLVLATGNVTTGSITIADGANGKITIAPNGTGITEILSTDAGSTGVLLDLYHDSSSPLSGDNVSAIRFYGRDSAGNKQLYGGIFSQIVDTTSLSEEGKMIFTVTSAGSAGDELELTGASLYPTTNDGLALGDTTHQYSDLFLAEGGVINWDNGDVTLTQTGNVLAVAGGDLRVSTADVGTNADSVPTISSTNTLTNKRITKRVGTTTSSATPTINTDNVDMYTITAQTVDITSFTTNLSGTPTDGQTLWIAITGTAARAITWGASFEASTVALPTTTVTTNRLDVGFVWNAATSKWRCVASA